MIWIKSCPRCRGDLLQNRDLYGWYVSCFQCGHHLSEVEEATFRLVFKGQTMVRHIATLPAAADTTRANTSWKQHVLAA